MHDSQAPTFRTARPDEIAPAVSLCPPAPELPADEPSHCFVAVDGPDDHIVGAVFWRKIPAENGTPEGVTFEWAMIPELTDTPVETDFLIALVTEIQLAVPEARWLSPSTSLPEGHPLAERLIQAAFQQEAAQTHHEASMTDVVNWLEKFPGSPTPLPATAPHSAHLHPLHEMLCGDDRPLRKSRLEHGFQAAARNEPTLFDNRCSVLFLDGEAIIAACLAAVKNGHLHLAALHLPTAPVQLLPEVLRQVITRAQLFAPPITVGFTLHPADPPIGLPALLEIPAFQRVGTSRNFRRELHFPG